MSKFLIYMIFVLISLPVLLVVAILFGLEFGVYTLSAVY